MNSPTLDHPIPNRAAAASVFTPLNLSETACPESPGRGWSPSPIPVVPCCFVVIAELEIFHSRPIAPTRRIALGQRNLPTDPPPGAGGLLLAGIVARMAPHIPAELREPLYVLLEDLAAGRRIPQPRVRHRFQTDTVGLLRSTHRLVARDGQLELAFEAERGLPVQHALAALYAAAQLPGAARDVVFEALRDALVWSKPVDARFIAEVMGGGSGSIVDLRAWNDPVAWALEVLGLEDEPSKRLIMKQYRTLLRDAHPDHGAAELEAAARIAELGQARDILLA